MDTKLLLTALLAGVLGPQPAAGAPLQLHFPDVAVIVGIGSGGNAVDIRTSENHPGAKVELRLDATGIASIAKVSTDTEGCVAEANVVTCRRTMDLVPDGESVAHIGVEGIGPAGTGQITISATVNGISLTPFKSKVEVTRPDKLIPLGTKVRAPGETKVKIKVGIKNAGPGAVAAREHFPDPIPVPVAAYIRFPGDTFAESFSSGVCFPWGPWPEGWGWLHPNEPSYWYACASPALEPGQTHWYELTIRINPQRRLVTGEIYLYDITGAQITAAIVIDTRDTLPVTGPPVRDLAIAATALIVPGVVLLFLVTRPPRRRPYQDED